MGNTLTTQFLLAVSIAFFAIMFRCLPIALQEAALPITQFGVATDSTSLYAGIMGICFGFGINTPYLNIIDQLANDGYTNGKLFGLGLGDQNNQQGILA